MELLYSMSCSWQVEGVSIEGSAVALSHPPGCRSAPLCNQFWEHRSVLSCQKMAILCWRACTAMTSFTTRALWVGACFPAVPGLAAAFIGNAVSPYTQSTSLPSAHHLDILILSYLVHFFLISLVCVNRLHFLAWKRNYNR